MKTDQADLLRVLAEEVKAELLFFDVEPKLAGVGAKRVIARVSQRHGGQQMYVPTVASLERDREHRDIAAAFTGRNLREVSIAFGKTPRQVRRILEKMKRR